MNEWTEVQKPLWQKPYLIESPLEYLYKLIRTHVDKDENLLVENRFILKGEHEHVYGSICLCRRT